MNMPAVVSHNFNVSCHSHVHKILHSDSLAAESSFTMELFMPRLNKHMSYVLILLFRSYNLLSQEHKTKSHN